MNISYNWLKNYINIDEKPEEISIALTSIGLEVGCVEEVQSIRGGLEGLVVGEVLTCENHENSDHLHVTTVNIGDSKALQIVCGAPNVAAGQKVVVATVGTKLYSGDESFTIKRSKIRGVESCGMICAEDEIGIGTSHDGIIVLPTNAPVGTLAKDYYGIKSDYVIEVDITPNRSDACSHYGVARDLAAFYALKNDAVKLTKPTVENFKISNKNLEIPVFVENTDACPRYSAVSISGVKVEESPDWLKNALNTIGLRPINNVVDITNYVLHEFGQPLHAFDADKISGKEVHVKCLPEGSEFVTLDEIERKLSANDLMICNKEKPMCIGGVFGGLTSGITENTVNVFLESAYFNPVSIRKTARRHGLNTDASFRFERGCDPANTVYVLKRCAALICEIAGGEVSSDIVDVYPNEIKPFDVEVSLQKINSLIGKEIGEDSIEKILKALEIKIISKENNVYQLQVPAYRVDVQRDVDVIEDILRIYGYDNVEISDNLVSTLSYSQKPDTYKLQRTIAEQLTAQGFNEILNNSLTKSDYYTDLKEFSSEKSVKIMNALSSDLNVMRQTLLFGGLENIAYNINRKNQDLKFYEFGNCYSYNAENKKENETLSAYSESFHLALWLTGNKSAQSWTVAEQKTSIFELKAYIENIFRRLGVDVSRLNNSEFSDELLSEAIEVKSPRKNILAVYGIVNPKLLKKFDIEQPVYYADLQWQTLIKEISNHKVSFSEISKFPEVKRDLSLLLDDKIRFSEIEQIARETERKLLKSVSLFDVYEGKNLEAGKKSYAVSFVLQDETKTLTDNQIDGIMNKIRLNLENKLGAKLR
jgi:phenylalanyl-tRNA synthetase, beta subunit, non-spirochete bacterial